MEDRSTRVRLTNTIFITQSLQKAAFIAIATLIGIVAVDLSGRESLTGVPSTVATIAQAFVALPIGLMMGRLGRRFGLTVGYSMGAVGALLGVVALMLGAFWLLLISAMFLGIGTASSEQSRFAAGDMFPEGESGRMIGRVVFAGTLGAIFGPMLITPGTWIALRLGLTENTGPWVIALILYVLATLVISLALRPEPNQLAATVEGNIKRKLLPGELPDTGRGVRELLNIPAVRLAVISMLISQAVMVALMVITPLYMVHHDHSNQQVGWVISAHTFGMFAFSGFTGWLIDRFGAVRVMLVGGVTLFVSAVVSALSPALPVVLFGLFLLGLGWNFGFIAGSSLLSDTLRGVERARMQGVGDMLIAGAAALGSSGSGPIYSLSGFLGVAVGGGILTIIFLYIVWLIGVNGRLERPVPVSG